MSKALDASQSIADLRRLAKARAHKMVFDYIDGGAEDELTLARNSSAFDTVGLIHRVLRGVDQVDMSTKLLGTELKVPFFLSPAAGNRLFHTDGERAVARAAEEIGTAYCLSTLSSVSIEDVAGLHSGPKWFQLYVWKDRGLVSEMLSRARAAGFEKLVLTVDFPHTGKRERDARNGFTIPPKLGLQQVIGAARKPYWSFDYVFGAPIRYANLSGETPAVSLSQFVAEQLHAGFDWDDAAWVLQEWGGDTILKGVVHPEDAVRARDAGFAAVSVSYHGGRQWDGGVSPLEMLPRLRDAIGEAYPLILDGGVRRGTHILKALASGANAVSFARPYLYGLAAGGYRGVQKALQILADEVRLSMALLGVSTIDEIGPDLIQPLNKKRN